LLIKEYGSGGGGALVHCEYVGGGHGGGPYLLSLGSNTTSVPV
jgi:hypothetical protein